MSFIETNKEEMAVALHSYWEGIETQMSKTQILVNNEEYFVSFGDQMICSKNNTMITNAKTSTIDGWNTGYGSIQIKPKKNKTYVWAIAVIQHNSKYPQVCIGIDEVSSDYTHTFFHGQKTTNYAYKSDGKKYSKTIGYGKGFSDAYSSGDIVLMKLDGYTLSFSKVTLDVCNKSKIKTIEEYIEYGRWIVAEKRIEGNLNYKMAVSLYGKTRLFSQEERDMSCVELIHHSVKVKEVDDMSADCYESKDTHFREEKDENCADFEDKFGLKTELIALEEKLAHFQRRFNKKSLAQEFEKRSGSLMIGGEVNNLQNRLQQFNKYLYDISTEISAFMRPEISNYKTWNIGQMIQWISCLDNGAYIKYLDVLRKGFKSEGIFTGEILCEVRKEDLRNAPFNIKEFNIRRKLAQHFESLRQINYASASNSIYDQGYNPHYGSNVPSAPYQQ